MKMLSHMPQLKHHIPNISFNKHEVDIMQLVTLVSEKLKSIIMHKSNGVI